MRSPGPDAPVIIHNGSTVCSGVMCEIPPNTGIRCHVRDYGGDPWGAWLGCSMPKARLAINIYIYGTGLSHGCVSRCQYSQYIQCIHTLTVKHAVYARFCAICAHTEWVITQRPTVQPAQTKRSPSQYIYRVGDAVLCLPPPARSDDCYRTGVLRQAHDGAPPVSALRL